MLPRREQSCLVFFGIGILARAVTLSALGLTLAEEMVGPRKSALVAPSLALVGKVLSCADGGVRTGRGY